MAELAMMATPACFEGAVIRLYGAEVLVVMVAPQVFRDGYESSLLVGAFHARFKRTVVLATRDRVGRPVFYGPVTIARVLAGIPFDALSWRRYRFRHAALPIPFDETSDIPPTECERAPPTRALRPMAGG